MCRNNSIINTPKFSKSKFKMLIEYFFDIIRNSHFWFSHIIIILSKYYIHSVGNFAKKSQNESNKRCNNCFSIIHRGLPHYCCSSQKVLNLEKIIEESKGKTKGHIVSSFLLKIKCSQKTSILSLRKKIVKLSYQILEVNPLD